MRYKLTYIDKVAQEQSNVFEKGKTLHFILENLEYYDIIKDFFESDVGKKLYSIIKDGIKEKRIALKIKDGQVIPCDYDDHHALMRGVIDVVNENYIIDYKSGKYCEYVNQKWLQLEFYALWLFLTSKYDEITVSYVYIEHNKTNTKTIKRSDLNSIVRNIFSRIKELTNFENNPTQDHNISPLCEYCSVRNSCKPYTEMKNQDSFTYQCGKYLIFVTKTIPDSFLFQNFFPIVLYIIITI